MLEQADLLVENRPATSRHAASALRFSVAGAAPARSLGRFLVCLVPVSKSTLWFERISWSLCSSLAILFTALIDGGSGIDTAHHTINVRAINCAH